MLKHFKTGAALCLIAALPSAALCQVQGKGQVEVVKWSDSSAKSLVANYRRGKVDLVAVLRQSGSMVSRNTLDGVADSLVGIALDARVASDTAVRWRSDAAITGLVQAGMRASAGSAGTPYDGALAHLIRIDRGLRDGSLRRVVINNLLHAGPVSETSSYLLSVATSADPGVAPFAMGELTRVLEPQTLAYKNATPAERELVRGELKKLWGTIQASPGKFDSLVPDETARLTLSRTASLQNWGKP